MPVVGVKCKKIRFKKTLKAFICLFHFDSRTLLAGQVSHVSHGLYRLPEARFISQDAIEVFLIEVHQPIHTDLLIFSQCPME